MKVYTLTADVTISIYTKVEADTLEEAIAISENRSIEHGSWEHDQEKYVWVSDEYDGEPQNIHEE